MGDSDATVYSFRTDDAELYGVNAAIILYNLRFWSAKNRANDHHVHECSDGNTRAWTYNSIKAFERLFPFWTSRQIRTAIDKLVTTGIVETGNWNKVGYDRTLWYCVMNDKSICQKRQIELTEKANRIDGNVEPIPDISTDDKPDRTRAKPRHPTLDVPMNQARYDTLCAEYGKTVADDYMERVKDWTAANGKRTVDYAARAANWMKRDNIPVKIGHQRSTAAFPICKCGGEVREYSLGEAMCKVCSAEWEKVNGEWTEVSEGDVCGAG